MYFTMPDQAVGEEEITLAPPPQEGVGDGAETVAAEILAETVAGTKIKEGQRSLLFLF